MTSPDRKPVLGTVIVPRGQVQLVRANMVVTPPRGAAWTQAIIGGVLLGGGIYFGLESNRLYDELKSDRNAGILVGDDSRGTRGKVYAIGADVAFLGTAVLGGLATYNFLKDPLPPSRLEMGRIREFAEQAKSSCFGRHAVTRRTEIVSHGCPCLYVKWLHLDPVRRRHGQPSGGEVGSTHRRFESWVVSW